MEIIRAENLCKIYGKGEFAAAVKESRSGKSTLLNCIRASGPIFVDGQNLFSMKEEIKAISDLGGTANETLS